MTKSYTSTQALPDFDLWRKRREKNALFSFTLELTARCNNNCRHCYINLPENDQQAKSEELSLEEIRHIVDQAVELGAVWCLITGGEPLLRDDFEEIYLYIKRQGLLVSVFTNGTLITQKHIDLFKKFPPRDLEITVYGITAKTYAGVTGRPDLFHAFMDGVNLLLENSVPINLKNVTIRANLNDFQKIAAFCRLHSAAPFRFDPLIHLRYDHDEIKNKKIRGQRLSAEEIAALESADEARHTMLQKNCDKLILPPQSATANPLFNCGAGLSDFVVSYNGYFCLCSSLRHPECVYDLRQKTVKEARLTLVPMVRNRKSTNPEFINNCAACSIVNLCIWCPAHAYLETGYMDRPSQYFCDVAEKRNGNMS